MCITVNKIHYMPKSQAGDLYTQKYAEKQSV